MDMVYDFGQRNMMMSGLRLHFNQFMLQTHERKQVWGCWLSMFTVHD